MALLLGVDTGGTYTDAVVLDDTEDRVIASAKSLTTRPDLSHGVGSAIDMAIANAGIEATDIAMVSLSTTADGHEVDRALAGIYAWPEK